MSSLTGEEYGLLHHRIVERNKTDALRKNKGNFGASMTLSPEARLGLRWWLSNADPSFRYTSHGSLYVISKQTPHPMAGEVLVETRKQGGDPPLKKQPTILTNLSYWLFS